MEQREYVNWITWFTVGYKNQNNISCAVVPHTNYMTRSACVDHLQAEFVLKLWKGLVVNVDVSVCCSFCAVLHTFLYLFVPIFLSRISLCVCFLRFAVLVSSCGFCTYIPSIFMLFCFALRYSLTMNVLCHHGKRVIDEWCLGKNSCLFWESQEFCQYTMWVKFRSSEC